MASDPKHPSPKSPLSDDLVVAGVVHDMNQLFGVIIGRAGKMLAANTDPKMKTDLEAILLAAQDAAVMAARLRGTVVESGLGNQRSPLGEVVAQAVLLAALVEDRHKWPVSVEVSATLFSDIPDQVLREVLQNLLRNAQTAMPDGGQLSVIARQVNDKIHLLVQDQGSGLADDIAVQVFEVGFTTSGQQDKGVGLPASRRLLESFGGQLNFLPSPDAGALFEMIIPVGEEVPAAESLPPELAKKIDASSQLATSVLVVDDDQAMREMLADVLSALDCTVITVRDAAGALAEVAANRFQIALLDQNLPGMKGMDLANEIRAVDPLLTLILVTGWGNEDLDIDPTASALDLLARKPLEFGAIKDLIGQGINLRNEKKQLDSKESTE